MTPQERIDYLEAALKNIARRENLYARDRLGHIEATEKKAKDALAGVWEPPVPDTPRTILLRVPVDKDRQPTLSCMMFEVVTECDALGDAPHEITLAALRAARLSRLRQIRTMRSLG